MRHRRGFMGTLIELFKVLLLEQKHQQETTREKLLDAAEEETTKHEAPVLEHSWGAYPPEVIPELVRQDIEESEQQGFETGASLCTAEEGAAPRNENLHIVRNRPRKWLQIFGNLLITFGIFTFFAAVTWILLPFYVDPQELNLSIENLGFFIAILMGVSMVSIALGKTARRRAKERLVQLAFTKRSNIATRVIDILTLIFAPLGISIAITLFLSPVFLGFTTWHLWSLWRASMELDSCIVGFIILFLPLFIVGGIVGYILYRLCFFHSWWGEELLGSIIAGISTIPPVWIMASALIPGIRIPFVWSGVSLASSLVPMLPVPAQTMYTLAPLEVFSLSVVTLGWGLSLGEMKGAS